MNDGRLRRVRNLVLGADPEQGLLFRIFLYLVFVSAAYIYLNPVLYMLVTMIKSERDLLDPTVVWIPNGWYWGHLRTAWEALSYAKTFALSAGVSVAAAALHCVSCAFAGYAFAKLAFPWKRTLFFILLVTFIIPPQVIVLPTIIAYNQLGFHDSAVALVVPAAFGFGVKGSLFVIIFRQFFRTQPKELEEAARMEGASAIRIFAKIMFPLARPAILVVFLFSFVWTWNDAYLPNMFMTTAETVPLAAQMSRLDVGIRTMLETGQAPLYYFEPIKMASSFLVIFPPLLLYLFTQRWFVESVERTGIVD